MRWCQWGSNDTYDNIFSVLPSLSVTHSLTHDHTISHANKHIHASTPSCQQINILVRFQQRTSLIILAACEILTPIAYFLCIPPGSYKIVILTILIKKQHILYVGPSTATTKQLIGSNVSFSLPNAMLDTLCIDTLILTEISIQTWYKYTRISIIYLINLHTGRYVSCIWH